MALIFRLLSLLNNFIKIKTVINIIPLKEKDNTVVKKNIIIGIFRFIIRTKRLINNQSFVFIFK